MCQYQYHYYGYCQHQEFILVKLCEGAITLAHFDKHQQKHNTEGAIVKALPTDTTLASPCAAKLNFYTTEPSIVLTGQVDHSIYPSSIIIHIIVRFVPHAMPLLNAISDMFQRHGSRHQRDEVSAHHCLAAS